MPVLMIAEVPGMTEEIYGGIVAAIFAGVAGGIGAVSDASRSLMKSAGLRMRAFSIVLAVKAVIATGASCTREEINTASNALNDAIDAVGEQIGKIIEAEWNGYHEYRKAPRTKRARSISRYFCRNSSSSPPRPKTNESPPLK